MVFKLRKNIYLTPKSVSKSLMKLFDRYRHLKVLTNNKNISILKFRVFEPLCEKKSKL